MSFFAKVFILLIHLALNCAFAFIGACVVVATLPYLQGRVGLITAALSIFMLVFAGIESIWKEIGKNAQTQNQPGGNP